MIRRTRSQLEEIEDLCLEWGKKLCLLPDEPDGACLLLNIFLNEQYTERNAEPR